MAAINAATDKVFKALSSQTALGEEPVSIQTPAMALAAVKKLPSEVAGSEMSIGGGKFGMPKASSSDNSSDPVDMKVWGKTWFISFDREKIHVNSPRPGQNVYLTSLTQRPN